MCSTVPQEDAEAMEPFTVTPTRNGYLVQGSYRFASNGPGDRPDHWRVFETIEALAAWMHVKHQAAEKVRAKA